jgi:2-hydroxychromene-2-carboxylate isomerase
MEPTGERMHRIFHAAWGQGEDVGDPAVLARIGIPTADIEHASSQKEALTRSTQAAIDAGAFGAPTFLVGDRTFWGQDRLHHVEACLRGWDPAN